MTITFVANHFCIRAVKQAIALKQLGHRIYGIGFKKPQFFGKLDAYLRCDNWKQLEESIKLVDKKTDLYYVHTEPYWLVFMLKELSKRPVLLDMHDSMQWRMPTKFEWRSAEERAAISMVDGFVFPSKPCQKLTPVTKPSIVLYSYYNEEFTKYISNEWMGGVVYEGRADRNRSPVYMNYCKYHTLMHAFRKSNIPFYMYVVWDSNAHIKEYNEAHVMPTMEYDKMIKAVASHDWGLCGNIDTHREWDIAMPNKLFEYLAAGIPVVAFNAKEVGRFVLKHGIGISVKSIKELKSRWDERSECQHNVLKKRRQFTMEANIGLLNSLITRLKTA